MMDSLDQDVGSYPDWRAGWPAFNGGDCGLADFPRLGYSMRRVREAGKALIGDLVWSADSEEEIREVFRVANSWRDSHALPMWAIRREVITQILSRKLDGLTVARLKQMPSIRRKLRSQPHHLNQLQDLGGCLAILPSIEAANTLTDAFANATRHEFYHTDDYVACPKDDGYRCRHLVYKFVGRDEQEAFSGLRVEIQIRSRLQHSWATAVEAIGLFRHEHLKSGQGDRDWLRFLRLMSAEIAEAERCEIGLGMAPRRERLAEIRELDARLQATQTLENLRNAVHYTDTYVLSPDYRAGYYLIRYNNDTGSVTVEPFTRAVEGAERLSRLEVRDSERGASVNTVLIEIETVRDLKESYPNYFGDVSLFVRNLRDITKGKGAKEYTMPPQRSVPTKPREKPDMSWFRGRKRWK